MSDKLISANKLMEYIYGSIEAMTKVGVAVDGEYLWGLINYAIEDAPTIDAEPVIRCKDCEYYNGEDKYCVNDIFAKSNGYCMYGKEKDE